MRRLMLIIGLLLVVALLVPVSCARTTSEEEMSVVEMVAPMPPRPEIREEAVAYEKGVAGASLPAAEERMVVRNGDMSLVVEDVVDARDEIARLAVRLDGYVVSSWISGEEEEMRGNISIRVPDEKFEQALVELRNLAVRVESESTSSRDVTEEYTDLEARLKNAEATESQYLALLDKAKDVEDIIRIYDSLSRVRREIEQIKGRMQYLERTSSMSLITARLQPAATAKPLIPVAWSALEALKSAIRGLVTFGQMLADIFIWIGIFSPVWIVAGGIVYGIIYWRRRRKAAQ